MFFSGIAIQSSAQTVIEQPQSNNYANWTSYGNSTLSGLELIITPNVGNTKGAAWHNSLLDVTKDFRMEFDVYLGTSNSGSDGATLTLRAPGTDTIGVGGGGMAVVGISPAAVLKMDTYFNGATYADSTNADNLGLAKTGTSPPFTLWPNNGTNYYGFGSVNIEDGAYHTVTYDYVASTGLLRVFWDGVRRLSVTTNISADFLNNSTTAYIGFTASSGNGAANEHKVRIRTYTRGTAATLIDPDNDGYSNEVDLDDDGDGIPDLVEGTGDTDGDGIPDHLDLDSDNDGINDVREVGLTDANGDGRADGTINSSGIISGFITTPRDTDGDGIPDHRDLDSDNDGVHDLFEYGSAVVRAADTNHDGFLSTADEGVTDLDLDGIMSAADGSTQPGDSADPAPVHSDNDTLPDYRDLRSTFGGNGVGGGHLFDLIRAGFPASLDPDQNGRIDGAQFSDADRDGIADEVDTNPAAFGWPGQYRVVTTLAASNVQPEAVQLNGEIARSTTLSGTLHFEYGTDATMLTYQTGGDTALPIGTGVQTFQMALSGLAPQTTYYYRAIVAYGSGMILRGTTLSVQTRAQPSITEIKWGPSGSVSADGYMDATIIPGTTTTPVIYRNMGGGVLDLHLSTRDLARNGMIHVLGEDAWWLEGASSSAPDPSVVTFRFYQAGTTTLQAMTGVHFRIEDAEVNEQMQEFVYWDATGAPVTVPWTSTIFSYSHTPKFTNGDQAVQNQAPLEGTTQAGKWIDVNLSGLSITGFEFRLRRLSVSYAGTVVITSLIGSPDAYDFDGTFSPISVNTDSSATAAVPDYRSQAVHTAGEKTTITQSPAPGTMLPAGLHEVILTLTTSTGETTQLGFHLTVVDRTPPEIHSPSNGYVPDAISSGSAMPDYASMAGYKDNVAVTQVIQSPPAGSLAVTGTTIVTISAYDARRNVTTHSFKVSVTTPEAVPGEVQKDTLASTSNSAEELGAPAASTFSTFGVPSLNDSQQLAFIGSYTSGATKEAGVFAGAPPQLIVSENDAAPGVSGAIFAKFCDPCLNNGSAVAPYVAFIARIAAPAGQTAIPTTSNMGIWTNLGDKLTLVARTDDSAGLGIRFKAFQSVSLVEDEVLFTATLSGGVTKANDVGVWKWTPAGGLQLVLREGQLINSVGGTQKIVDSFQMLGAVAGSSGHSRHHAAAGFGAARVVCTDKTVITYVLNDLGAPTRTTPVAQTGFQLIPGFPARSQGVPSMSAHGFMAFSQIFAIPKGSGITAANNAAIVAEVGSGWTIAVRKGDPVATAEPMTWTSFADPVVNDSGMVAFMGAATAGTKRATVLASVIPGKDAVVVAENNQKAPDCDGGLFKTISSFALPDGVAGPVFTAVLESRTGTTSPGPGGVTTANDNGLWAVDGKGNTRLILREGQEISGKRLAAFTLLSVVPGSPGQARSYNSHSSLVVKLVFSDKSEAITVLRLP
jgi:hypothetical protein